MKVYFCKIEKSMEKKRLSEQICSFTDRLNVNGMIFKRGMWLPIPEVLDDGNWEISEICEICDLVLMNATDVYYMFAVCKKYHSMPTVHYAGYIVEVTSLHSEFVLINIGTFLETRHYPIATHTVDGEVMFRCKRF